MSENLVHVRLNELHADMKRFATINRRTLADEVRAACDEHIQSEIIKLARKSAQRATPVRIERDERFGVIPVRNAKDKVLGYIVRCKCGWVARGRTSLKNAAHAMGVHNETGCDKSSLKARKPATGRKVRR